MGAYDNYGLVSGIAGIGQGAIKGLELARRHNREDTEAEREEELHGLRKENLELGIESTRGQMKHREAIRPLEIERTEQSVERGRQQMTIGDQTIDLNQMEIDAADRAEETEAMMRRFAGGDVAGVQDWYNQYADNDIEEIARLEDGRYRLHYSDGDDETLSKDDLGARVAAMTDPESWLAEMTKGDSYGPISYEPGVGWGQMGDDGKWHQLNPESGGARGGSPGDSLPSAVMTSIRRSVDRKLMDALDANGLAIYNSEHGKELATLSERLAQRLYVNGDGRMTPVEASDEAMMAVTESHKRARSDLGERTEGASVELTPDAEQDWVRRRTRELLGLHDSGLGDREQGGAIPSEPGVAAPGDGVTEVPKAPSGTSGTSPDQGSAQTYVGTGRDGQQVQVTMEQIQATAEKRGKTVEQVISELGLRPAQ